MKTYFEDDACTLYLGDSLEVIPTLPDASVDAVVCDPPYGLEFMGKDWDGSDGFRRSLNPADVGRDSVFGRTSAKAPEYRTKGAGDQQLFQAWCAQWAAECLRVLKPGGHLLAFGAPRTYHRLAAGIEDAGFEIRDSIHWIYGSGMPKGVNISKAIDKRREDRPEVLEVTRWLSARRIEAGWSIAAIDALFGFNGMASHWCATAGKAACVPTLEQWATIRDALGFDDAEIRPLIERLNGRKGEIGEAWAQREVVGDNPRNPRKPEHLYGQFSGDGRISVSATDEAKRWEGWNTQLKPAHEPVVVARKPTGFNTTVANVLQHGTGAINIDACRTEVRDAAYAHNAAGDRGHAENRGRQLAFKQGAGSAHDLGRWPTNVVFAHGDCDENCEPGCPVAELDAQSGVLTSGANPARRSSPKFGQAYGEFEGDRDCKPARSADSGSASRFFPVFKYEAKAPKSERPVLADGTQHVSVKPLDLMCWLVRLVTPPGGTILDPFAGSGTSLEAAALEGFNAIGIEREQPYADLCVARLSKPLQPSLFGDLG